MKQEPKDETRWLLRLFSLILAGLAIQGIRVQFRRISAGEEIPILSFILFIGIVLLLFWLAYRLWRCPSLWGTFLWIPETPPLFLYCQCHYFRLNKHIRCGLVAGIILLVMEMLLHVMTIFNKGAWFWDCIGYVWAIAHRPLAAFWNLFNFSAWTKEYQKVIFVVSLVLYVFTIGFVVGWTLSYLKERLIREKEITNIFRCEDAGL